MRQRRLFSGSLPAMLLFFFTRLVFKKNENFQYLGFVLHFICAHLGSYALLTVSLVLFGLK